MSQSTPTRRIPREQRRGSQENQLSQWLLEASGFLAAVLDDENRLVQANRGLQRFLDGDAAQLEDAPLDRFAAPASLAALQRLLRKARKQSTPQEIETECISLTGQRRWAAWTFEALPERPGWLLASGKDVSQRHSSPPLEQDDAIVYRRAFEQLPALIDIQDIQTGQTLWVNHDLATLLGYAEAKAGQQAADFKRSLLHPDDRQPMAEHEQKVRGARDGELVEAAYRLHCADGRWRWFLSRDTVFTRDADGAAREVLSLAQDITRQRQSEELQLRLNEIVESTPDVAATIGVNGNVIYLNWAGRELFDLRLKTLENLALEDLGPKWAIDRIQQEGIPDAVREGYWSGEAALLASDGREIPVSLVIVAHPSATQDSVEYWSLVARDISEARALQDQLRQARDDLEARVVERSDALRRSEALYRSLAEAAPDIVFVVGQDGRVNYANQRAAHLFGGTPEEVQGRTLAELLPEETAAQHLIGIERVIEVGQPLAFEALNLYNEKQHWLDTILVPVHDEAGRISRVLGVSRDVTRRKQIEEELYRSRHMLQLILDHIPQRVFWKDIDLRFLGANKAFLQDAGLSYLDELIGHDDSDLGWGEDANRYQQDDHTVIESGVGKLSYEEPQRDQDGEVRWLRTSKIPLRERDGRIFGILGTYEDITEIRRAEQAMAALNEELSRSNTDLEQFAYVASHDLQEPLRMIASYVELLERRYDEILDERGKKYVRYIVEGAQRMQQLITDLLVYSRVGTRSKPFTQVQCRPLVEQVVFNLKVALEESKGAVEVGPLPTVFADEMQLFQVFQNLISNALKFRGEAPPQVQVEATRGERCWQFAVRDNGIGIDAQQAERIFIVFQRLHARDEYPGTGIGLAICKKIVQRHAGKIWVESTPGQGSTFFFTIADPPQ